MLAALLYGVSPRDEATLAGGTIFLLIVAALASLAPAIWATRIDVMRAIRQDG
jgi:hypothetical protein